MRRFSSRLFKTPALFKPSTYPYPQDAQGGAVRADAGQDVALMASVQPRTIAREADGVILAVTVYDIFTQVNPAVMVDDPIVVGTQTYVATGPAVDESYGDGVLWRTEAVTLQ